MSDSGSLTRDVLLRIRAQNLTAADFQTVSTAINRLTGDLDKQVEAAKRAEITQGELRGQIKQLDDAVRSLTGLTTLVDRYKQFETQVGNNAKRLDEARAKLEAHQGALASSDTVTKRAQATLESYTKEVARQEGLLESNRQKLAEHGEALRKAGIDVNNLTDAETRFRQLAEQSGAALARLNAADVEYARNKRMAAEAARAQADEERRIATERAAALQREQAIDRDRARLAAESANQARDYLTGLRQQREAEVALAEQRRRAVAQAAEEAKQLAGQQYAARERAESERVVSELRRRMAERSGILRKQVKEEEEIRLRPIADIEQPRTDALGRPGRGASGAIGLFGLRPYELTNLGYQINDVVSGFASGQHAAQIFAQQGGQFIQIFGLAALRYLPAVAAAAGAVAVAFGALNVAAREVSSNREFAAAITANVNAVNYTKEALTALRKEVRDMGVSWTEAGQVIRTAIEGNIRQDRIKEFAQAARDVADVTKTSVPDAMKDLVAAFTGGEGAVGKLNDSLKFLDETQSKHVRDLFAAGKAEEARAYALELLATRYRNAADEGLSPLTKETRELSKAWDNLLTTLSSKGVFEYVIHEVNLFVTNIKDAIEAIDGLIKKQKQTPNVSPRSTASSQQQRDAEDAAAGSYPRGAAGQPVATAPIPSGADSRFDPRGLKIDTESLRQLASLLTEASTTLPPGYRVEATSTERPGAIVAGTNQPSEHGAGRAIDVRIVDANGQPVPGSMGPGGPLYQQLDRAMAELAAKQFPGVPLAIGSTFSNRPDAGHYSLGGSEAANNSTRRGVATGPVPNEAAAQALRDEQERLAAIRAESEERALQLERAKAEREARERGGSQEQQDAFVRARLDQVRYQQTLQRIQEESRDRKQAIEDARHLTDIRAAGERAVEAARGRGVTGFRDLLTARQEGEAEERTRLQRLDAEKDRLIAIDKQLAQIRRGLDLKNVSDLARALAAVDEQFLPLYENLKKSQEQATDSTRKELESRKALIDQLKAQAQAEARIQSLKDQSKTAESTRNQLVQTYNQLQESGQLTTAEKETKIKEAYDLTKPAIDEATAALEKFLSSAEGLQLPPEKIALLRAEIQRLRADSQYIDPFFKGLSKTIENSFANQLDTAFNTVAEAIGGVIAKTKSWKDVMSSLGTAAAQFFSGLLKDIATYILKLEAVKLLQSTGILSTKGGGGIFGSLFGSTASSGVASSVTSESGGGIFSFLSGANPAAVFHEGGVVGLARAPMRAVNPYWFADAPRYHQGGLPGLGPDEQAAILRKGEEVLTRSDPRNILNQIRGGGAGDVHIRSILVADPDLVPGAMAGATGERIVVQHLKNNAATVRQLVRG